MCVFKVCFGSCYLFCLSFHLLCLKFIFYEFCVRLCANHLGSVFDLNLFQSSLCFFVLLFASLQIWLYLFIYTLIFTLAFPKSLSPSVCGIWCSFAPCHILDVCCFRAPGGSFQFINSVSHFLFLDILFLQQLLFIFQVIKFTSGLFAFYTCRSAFRFPTTTITTLLSFSHTFRTAMKLTELFYNG